MSKRNRMTKTQPAPVAPDATTTTQGTKMATPAPEFKGEPTEKPPVASGAAPTDPLEAIRLRAEQMAKTPTKDSPKVCLCGCKGMTKGGLFIPGHNGKLFREMLNEERRKLALAQQEPSTVQ